MTEYFLVQEYPQKTVLMLCGNQRVVDLAEIAAELREIKIPLEEKLILDGSALNEIDSSVLSIIFKELSQRGVKISSLTLSNFKSEHLQLIELIKDRFSFNKETAIPNKFSIFEQIGRALAETGHSIFDLLAFMGETAHGFWRLALNPKLFRPKEFFVQLELGCIDAIPICALVTFLIGIVVAYLFAGQFEKYGANIFIVDAVSLAMCRELSPIIIAIIVAGRSGSAYTAQIGTMKINEEIDAMKILGLSPLQVLVIPRIVALVIAMPLLVFVGNVVGILGGLIIADLQLGVSGTTYLQRLQIVLTARHILAGLIKAPVFAIFIALIGCQLGFGVENNARSVGLNTTATVVKSIVAVILLNAAFAIIFVNLGF